MPDYFLSSPDCQVDSVAEIVGVSHEVFYFLSTVVVHGENLDVRDLGRGKSDGDFFGTVVIEIAAGGFIYQILVERLREAGYNKRSNS